MCAKVAAILSGVGVGGEGGRWVNTVILIMPTNFRGNTYKKLSIHDTRDASATVLPLHLT